MGIITALTQTSPEELRKEIRKCKQLTKKPFGVNITLLPAMVPPDYKAYCQVIIDEKVSGPGAKVRAIQMRELTGVI